MALAQPNPSELESISSRSDLVNAGDSQIETTLPGAKQRLESGVIEEFVMDRNSYTTWLGTLVTPPEGASGGNQTRHSQVSIDSASS